MKRLNINILVGETRWANNGHFVSNGHRVVFRQRKKCEGVGLIVDQYIKKCLLEYFCGTH